MFCIGMLVYFNKSSKKETNLTRKSKGVPDYWYFCKSQHLHTECAPPKNINKALHSLFQVQVSIWGFHSCKQLIGKIIMLKNLRVEENTKKKELTLSPKQKQDRKLNE